MEGNGRCRACAIELEWLPVFSDLEWLSVFSDFEWWSVFSDFEWLSVFSDGGDMVEFGVSTMRPCR